MLARRLRLRVGENGTVTDDLLEQLRVTPGASPRLDRRSTDARIGAASRQEGLARLQEGVQRLSVLHNRLGAESARSLLLVLQGMDASGKDGTIRHVFTGVNPQGCSVVSFREPTTTELAHDFLWRVHAHCPARGEMTIFNRSHYEDVVVVRVRELAPERVWRRRYEHIRAFERMLIDEGTTVVKVFLHVSGRAARTASGAARKSREALEVPNHRPRGAEALGRLPGCVRGRDPRDVDEVGAVVRRPC